MCWHTVTLCLNPKLFFFFFFLEAKERGEFMALQLLALVTVNWLLSEAVKVFYGPPVCAGTLSGFTPVRRAELLMASPASPHLATELSYSTSTGPRLLVVTFFSVPLALHFTSLSVPYLPAHFYVSLLWRDRQTKRLLLCWLSAWESCASYLWTETLWVALRHWEGTSTTKDSCLLQSTIDFHHGDRKTFMEETRI